ncbi:MAG TPA: hypothetical protein G4N95_09765 [Anaerolineae bacterium]|nr:hypothetical protein [Anaerolineae bacterium]
MPGQLVRLIFPQQMLNVPVINDLIRQYNLTVNILRANINPREGWIDLQITGNSDAIEDAILWLTNQGIEVVNLAQ